jgi:hypothetical protein
MTNQITTSNVIESVVIDGDLSKLSPEQRVSYYKAVCTSLDLNPLTRPFNYITLNGKLTLYATKTAADQLRNNHNVSVDDVNITEDTDSYTVIVKGHDATGRSDVEIGVVSKKDMQGNLGNAKMKAVTKAKRRLTLSLCGLGMLDETEIETIPQAKPVTVNVETGEVVATPAVPPVVPQNGNGKLTIDEAKAVTNSHGVKYGDLDIGTLQNMERSITKKLRDGGYNNDEQTTMLHKLEAITAILASTEQPTREG